jgi:hypothetical protein
MLQVTAQTVLPHAHVYLIAHAGRLWLDGIQQVNLLSVVCIMHRRLSIVYSDHVQCAAAGVQPR